MQNSPERNLLRVIWLWLVVVVVISSPQVSFAYDGQSQTTVAYDSTAESIICYDTASVFATDKEKSGTTERCVPFAKFTKFLAAEGGVLNGANYAQRTFSSTFSTPRGPLAGLTVEDAAAALRSGTLSPADVPIQYIVQDGNTLMLNTRSAQALEQAGIPRSAWNAVDMTGDAAAQARLAAQLQRNGLTSQGIPTVTPSGR